MLPLRLERTMVKQMSKVVEIKLGDDTIEVEVLDDGSFELPQRLYTTAQLKRIARDINRDMRRSAVEQEDWV